ncbi:MAG TPA: maleylacetoacetate isomerase [Polyangiaceae bacterium]|nr:maleylacetoacetate isomerase [Polyangiaceae bacterium]
MKLYSYYRSSSAYRVRIVLHLKRVPFELVPVNLAPGHTEQHTDAYRAVNAFEQVPTLEWTEGGVTRRLTQSVAIAEWLDARFPEPPLLPDDALARARVREAVEIVNSGTQPLHNSSVLALIRDEASDEASRRFARRALERGLGALEAFARAHGGGWCVGDELTLADVFLVPALFAGRRYEAELSGLSTLLRIEERTRGIDAFEQARPERQPDATKAGGQT